MAQDKKWQLLLDLLVLTIVGIPLLVFSQWVTPYRRGFFETDVSIRLPFKRQSVSEEMLGCMGFLLNVVTILIIEYLQDRKGKNLNQKYLFGWPVSSWAWTSYTTIRTFSFGAACQQLTANLTKYVIGRLRPHFIDLCRPIYNASSPLNALGYIQDYTCEFPLDPRLRSARLSFPSAHSSFGMYAAVFFILYIQVKGKWRGTKLLRHAVQFFILLGAWYVGLTRVVEHYHHWGDVAAGFLNGAVYGCMVVIYVLKPKKQLPTTWQDTVPVRPEPALPRPVPAPAR